MGKEVSRQIWDLGERENSRKFTASKRIDPHEFSRWKSILGVLSHMRPGAGLGGHVQGVLWILEALVTRGGVLMAQAGTLPHGHS